MGARQRLPLCLAAAALAESAAASTPSSTGPSVHLPLSGCEATPVGCWSDCGGGISKRTLPIAGLVMSMLSNLFRGRDALDPFFVAQCRGHIIALAWDLLPLTALLDAVRRARESAGAVVLASGAGNGAEGREREEEAKLVGAEAKAALSVAVSTLECLKTMATMEDSESVFEHRARRDWHRSHGKQVVTIDLLERTLQ